MAISDPGELDRRHMAHALRLAGHGLGRTHPNPTVGCILTQEGRVIGQGWHRKAGSPHAEVEALLSVPHGEVAGATAYVTLEPCSHFGRTPPCADALIKAQVGRVVIAMEDPNPLVAGKGLARLRQAGIQVTLGVLQKEAAALIRPFVTWVTRRRPLVTLKSAASLDGKIATWQGESQWITGPAARQKAHRLRDTHDAILVGIGTVLADDPQLTCRLRGGRDPIRVVVDSHLRTPMTARVLTASPTAPTWIVTTQQGLAEQPAKQEAWAQNSLIRLLVCGEDGQGRVDLSDLFSQLGQLGVTSVLSEAGGRLAASLVENQWVDRLALFLAPRFIGGVAAAGMLHGQGVAHLSQTPRLSSWQAQRLGGDLFIMGDVCYDPTVDPHAQWVNTPPWG